MTNKIEWGGTPGPWHVEADMRSERTGDPYDFENGYRDYLAGWNIMSSDGEIVGIEGIIPGGSAEINARALAAVPEMVAFLRSMAARKADPATAMDTVRAILAKIDNKDQNQ